MSFKKFALSLVVITANCVGTLTAHAQNSRTFVSAVGTNNSQCSATEPCATFAEAIAATNSGGDINCLTPGGFGPLTISMPVTIDCEGSSNGGISGNTSGDSVIVTATGAVNLIGLDINGGGVNAFGVAITGAANVLVRNCKIYNFPTGDGIVFEGAGGTLVVDNTVITGTDTGIQESATSGAVNMSVRNSTITHGTYGILVQVSGGTHAGATIEQTTLAFNTIGLAVQNSGAVAVLGGSTVVNNGTGVSNSSSGIVYSFKNNQIGGNGTDGTPLTAYPGGPLN